MKEILMFKSVQDMNHEADDFLSKMEESEEKACVRLLLVAGYAYIDEFVGEQQKKTYANLAVLLKSEFCKSNGGYLKDLMQQIPTKSRSRRVYELYMACRPETMHAAWTRLMALLLPYMVR